MNQKNTFSSLWRCLWGIFLILNIFLSISAWAGETKQVAILPFVINAPDRMEYLREGIQDMLASRLSWEDKIVVLDRSQVQKIYEKISGPVNESRALQMGKQLGADVVLWGSINVIGSSVSIDVSLLDISLPQPIKKFNAQAKGMDDVIHRVDEISDNINEKVFGRVRTASTPAASTGTQPARSPEPSSGQAAPEKAPLSLKGFVINALSPQIIMNAGGFDMAGVWRSTTLPFALVDIAFGDLDGDGKVEAVVISKNRIYIFRYSQDKFEKIKEIPGGRYDNYIAVDVADIHGTGLPQIFVTNYRNDGLRSLTLSWNQGEYKTIAENIPYYLRVHQMPGGVPVLLGQQKYGDLPFNPAINILSFKDGRYVSVERLKVPEGLTVFNFVKVDLNNDGSSEILHLNRNNRLLILSDKGKVEYSSSEFFGGTVNTIAGLSKADNMLVTLMDEENTREYIPARLIVTSVLNPGKKEIILNKNKGSVTNDISARFRSYSSGEIYSLSWDGVIMRENWRTQTISDYVANYGVADFKNNGQKQLVVGVVQSTGLPYVSDARSVLYCYDLGDVKPSQK